MNDRKLTGHRMIYVFLLVFTLLFTGNAVFGHKDKPHPAVDSNTVDTDSIPNDSVQVVMDSVYAIIQDGYQNLQALFQRSCYDCHSDQTTYPWYHKLPFVKGIIDDDIKEARKHLDLSREFPFIGHGTPSEDLEAIKQILNEGEMPPFEYKMLHWDAGFSTEEIESTTAWIDNSLKLITAHSTALSPSEEM